MSLRAGGPNPTRGSEVPKNDQGSSPSAERAAEVFSWSEFPSLHVAFLLKLRHFVGICQFEHYFQQERQSESFGFFCFVSLMSKCLVLIDRIVISVISKCLTSSCSFYFIFY